MRTKMSQGHCNTGYLWFPLSFDIEIQGPLKDPQISFSRAILDGHLQREQ